MFRHLRWKWIYSRKIDKKHGKFDNYIQAYVLSQSFCTAWSSKDYS